MATSNTSFNTDALTLRINQAAKDLKDLNIKINATQDDYVNAIKTMVAEHKRITTNIRNIDSESISVLQGIEKRLSELKSMDSKNATRSSPMEKDNLENSFEKMFKDQCKIHETKTSPSDDLISVKKLLMENITSVKELSKVVGLRLDEFRKKVIAALKNQSTFATPPAQQANNQKAVVSSPSNSK